MCERALFTRMWTYSVWVQYSMYRLDDGSEVYTGNQKPEGHYLPLWAGEGAGEGRDEGVDSVHAAVHLLNAVRLNSSTIVPLLKDPSHKRPPPVTDHYYLTWMHLPYIL